MPSGFIKDKFGQPIEIIDKKAREDIADILKHGLGETYDDTEIRQLINEKQPKGNYALKSEIPSIEGLASEEWVEGKGYLTEHQNLDDYAKKEDLPEEYDDAEIREKISDLETSSTEQKEHLLRLTNSDKSTQSGKVWGTTEDGAGWVNAPSGGSGSYDDTEIRGEISQLYESMTEIIPVDYKSEKNILLNVEFAKLSGALAGISGSSTQLEYRYTAEGICYGIDLRTLRQNLRKDDRIYLSIKNADLIRIGRSKYTVDELRDAESLPKEYGVLRVTNLKNDADTSFDGFVEFTVSTNTIMVYCGKNSNPIIKITHIPIKERNYISISDYPRADNEVTDNARIQRCFNENEDKTVYFPDGEYEISETITGNKISMICGNRAHFFPSTNFTGALFEITYLNTGHEHYSIERGFFDCRNQCRGISLKGGHNVTLRDCYIRNPYVYGVFIRNITGISTSKYYINNVTVRGTEDVTTDTYGFKVEGSDHHFVDCAVSNIKGGFWINAGACRFERCHDWNAKNALINETVGFTIWAKDCTFTDCYIDTLKVGFDINANAQFLMCNGYNNLQYGMTNEIYFANNNKSHILIIGGAIVDNRGTIISDETNVTKIGFNNW